MFAPAVYEYFLRTPVKWQEVRAHAELLKHQQYARPIRAIRRPPYLIATQITSYSCIVAYKDVREATNSPFTISEQILLHASHLSRVRLVFVQSRFTALAAWKAVHERDAQLNAEVHVSFPTLLHPLLNPSHNKHTYSSYPPRQPPPAHPKSSSRTPPNCPPPPSSPYPHSPKTPCTQPRRRS
jgi:hypothetical protein